jgi:mono/diheme cytochrome c family protein
MTRLASFSLLLLTGCWQRPYLSDVPEISARYALKYQGACTSWLTSHVTGFRYCASPAFVVMPAPTVAAGPTFESLASGPTDPEALAAHGEKVYTAVCATCHQASGTGVPGSFPPLAGSGEFYGSPENHAKILVHGLSGAITVQGVAFDGVMPPQGSALSDYDVAAVATFERSSWGNADGPVLPEQVAAIR